MASETTETAAKCPKCRGQNLTLTETWDGATIMFDVWDGQREVNGILDNGDPTRLEGKCWGCGHSWRFRKTVNAESLDKQAF